MPPPDSQTLAGTAAVTTSNPKITCETLHNDDHVEEHPDFPPESFWLSKDAELDWFDRNAFLDRKDSAKGPNPNQNHSSNISSSNPSSQRFSVTKKSKSSILGLPKPQQKPCLVDARHRRNQTNSRLFPKRGVESSSAAQPMAEPSSPKVSCMGRVRSRRDRNRRLKNRQRSLKSTSEKPMAKPRKKKGLWKNIRSIFTGSGHKPDAKPDTETNTNTNTSRATGHVLSRDGSAAVNAPGLGGMARFSSGRKSDGWVGDVVEIRSGQLEGSLARFSSGRRSDGWIGDVAEIKSEPLDGSSGALRKRRDGVGPLQEVNCGRDWGTVGPASV
uniref:Uncharacterized protein n=1 Tax=Kalanchoe fedtschenkoi TaxID=63787 RepID=A0A7N0V107_KALFE